MGDGRACGGSGRGGTKRGGRTGRKREGRGRGIPPSFPSLPSPSLPSHQSIFPCPRGPARAHLGLRLLGEAGLKAHGEERLLAPRLALATLRGAPAASFPRGGLRGAAPPRCCRRRPVHASTAPRRGAPSAAEPARLRASRKAAGKVFWPFFFFWVSPLLRLSPPPPPRRRPPLPPPPLRGRGEPGVGGWGAPGAFTGLPSAPLSEEPGKERRGEKTAGGEGREGKEGGGERETGKEARRELLPAQTSRGSGATRRTGCATPQLLPRPGAAPLSAARPRNGDGNGRAAPRRSPPGPFLSPEPAPHWAGAPSPPPIFSPLPPQAPLQPASPSQEWHPAAGSSGVLHPLSAGATKSSEDEIPRLKIPCPGWGKKGRGMACSLSPARGKHLRKKNNNNNRKIALTLHS